MKKCYSLNDIKWFDRVDIAIFFYKIDLSKQYFEHDYSTIGKIERMANAVGFKCRDDGRSRNRHFYDLLYKWKDKSPLHKHLFMKKES